MRSALPPEADIPQQWVPCVACARFQLLRWQRFGTVLALALVSRNLMRERRARALAVAVSS